MCRVVLRVCFARWRILLWQPSLLQATIIFKKLRLWMMREMMQPESRIPYRVLLRITNIGNESNEQVVDVIIPGWNPYRAVRFPLALISLELHAKLSPGVRLFAKVNIGAEKSEDLYFREFELASAPDDDYESIVETLEILEDEELLGELRQSIQEANGDKGERWEAVKKELGWA